ncbi:hypothetical protein BCT63_05355 [Vibrio kanaloae]|uniref:hypothetical protein n=1 Tax=Vibrio kanaloae TaxID=170673 RepID=UPI000C81D420|nr:hypothetical protein [Vibrio kanaloae]PMM07021.1 hypothetical protein BCT63_05355 [Vibrio kanaloae]
MNENLELDGMKHLEAIEEGINNGSSYRDIVRKVYLTYPTHAFIDDEETQYEMNVQFVTAIY